MDPDGMIALLNYRVCRYRYKIYGNSAHLSFKFQEDGVTRKYGYDHEIPNLTYFHLLAFFTFWKDGLKEVKLWFTSQW